MITLYFIIFEASIRNMPSTWSEKTIMHHLHYSSTEKQSATVVLYNGERIWYQQQPTKATENALISRTLSGSTDNCLRLLITVWNSEGFFKTPTSIRHFWELSESSRIVWDFREVFDISVNCRNVPRTAWDFREHCTKTMWKTEEMLEDIYIIFFFVRLG